MSIPLSAECRAFLYAATKRPEPRFLFPELPAYPELRILRAQHVGLRNMCRLNNVLPKAVVLKLAEVLKVKP